MALPPESRDAFVREVDEAVRQDWLLSVWQSHGRAIIAAIVGTLVLFGAYLFWKDHSIRASGETAEKADAMLRAPGGGAEQTKLIAELGQAGQPGYRAIARITRASAAAEKGDIKGAAAQFGAMAADDKLAEPYRDLALVRQVALSFDAMSPQQVVDKLKPLAVEGKPWFGSAGEMVAIAYMKMGKRDLAGTTFAAIARDGMVPATLRSRAQQMASLLGVDMAGAEKSTPKQPEQAKDGTAGE